MGKSTTYTPEQWRVWKRNQRARPNRGTCNCGRKATDWAHTGKSLSSSVVGRCRACHTRRDNLAGLH